MSYGTGIIRGMAEPARSLPHPRLELSLVEARTRFVQLARLAGLTNQTTVVTEDGRPLAAIVPIASTLPAEAGRSATPPDRAAQLGRSSQIDGSTQVDRSSQASRSAEMSRSPQTGRFPETSRFAETGRSSPASRSAEGGRLAEVGQSAQAGRSAEPDRPNPAAAGWIRRIDKLRAEFRRQHVGLEQALEDAWRQIDRLRPPGTDPETDALRTAHADLRRPPSTA